MLEQAPRPQGGEFCILEYERWIIRNSKFEKIIPLIQIVNFKLQFLALFIITRYWWRRRRRLRGSLVHQLVYLFFLDRFPLG